MRQKIPDAEEGSDVPVVADGDTAVSAVFKQLKSDSSYDSADVPDDTDDSDNSDDSGSGSSEPSYAVSPGILYARTIRWQPDGHISDGMESMTGTISGSSAIC